MVVLWMVRHRPTKYQTLSMGLTVTTQATPYIQPRVTQLILTLSDMRSPAPSAYM